VVLSLFAIYWVFVVLIQVFARDVFDRVGRLAGDQRPAEIAECWCSPPPWLYSPPASSEPGARPPG